jgi:hypothetical protein
MKARGDEMAPNSRCQNPLASGGYPGAFPLELFVRLDKGRNRQRRVLDARSGRLERSAQAACVQAVRCILMATREPKIEIADE